MASTWTTTGHTHQARGGIASHYDTVLNPTFTTNLWRFAPMLERLHDPHGYALLDEQWQSYNAAATTGDYVLTQVTSGTGAISTTYIGTLALDAGAATAHQGVQVQRLKSMWLPAADKHLWFETKVRMTTAIIAELFIGLAASDTTIIASGAMNVNNHIGWSSVTNDGVLLFDCDKAATGTTAAATTISTSAWTSLGFFYDGSADTIQQYVNGVAVGSAVATTYIPKAAMYFTACCQGGGTGQPVLNIGASRILQLR